MLNNRQCYKPKQANILTRQQSKYEKLVIKKTPSLLEYGLTNTSI